MKRFHIHTRVADLQASVNFYTKLFASEPSRLESDYAKWMLEDPRINFAISTRAGGEPGIDHLGFQVDTDDELALLQERAQRADMPVSDEGETSCCYARSHKHWVTDPQGIAWEQFRTMEGIPQFALPQSSAVSQTPAANNTCCASDGSQGGCGPVALSATARDHAQATSKPRSACC
jgi:catechol 2,3-dioxygenase-like lactoylglutathione lyase family enzyme